jgi:hypothetical protein
VCCKYLIVVPRPMTAAPRRYLTVVKWPFPAAPLVERRKYFFRGAKTDARGATQVHDRGA